MVKKMEDGEMPVELLMDLLVDEELPEDRRRALLLSLDREGGSAWRELSMRFLERQVEKRSVRDLIAGGRLVPVEEDVRTLVFPRAGWLWSGRMMGVAAGLMIAAGSALVTGYWVQHVNSGKVQMGRRVEMAKTSIPGAAMGVTEPVSVEFPVVGDGSSGTDRRQSVFFDDVQQAGMTRRLVIQPDAPGRAMVIPVNSLPMKVY